MRKISLALLLAVLFQSVNMKAQSVSGGTDEGTVRRISVHEYRLLALANNLSVRGAQFDLEKSKHLHSFAFTKFFPQVKALGGFLKPGLLGNGELSMQADIDMTRIFRNPENANLALDGTIDFTDSVRGMFGAVTITQPVFAGGRIVNSYRLAGKGVAASSFQLQMTRNNVYAEAESKYYQLVLLSELIETLELYLGTLDALRNQVSEALSRGAASRSDFLRVKLKHEEVSIQQEQAKAMFLIAERDFKLFAGLSADSVLELGDGFDGIVEPDFDPVSFPSRLAERPEYQLLTIQRDAARLQEAVTIGSYMPSMEIGAAVTGLEFWMNGKTLKDLHASYYDVSGFIMLNIPVSDWWGGYHKIKEASYSSQNAAAQLETDTNYLLLDMQNKYVSYQTAFRQIKLAETGLEYAEQNRSEYSDRYRAGLSVLGDYIEALAFEHESRTKLNQAKASYFSAQNAFMSALGEHR
ncbi:MAG: TolC family protein [Spirochaetaceae bacterium]|nr:TolC family protein [Spirochaetaceae bacterium]